ncbi:MAG: hypothetical protein V3V08_20055 [Nannocystaceae bacterium]
MLPSAAISSYPCVIVDEQVPNVDRGGVRAGPTDCAADRGWEAILAEAPDRSARGASVAPLESGKHCSSGAHRSLSDAAGDRTSYSAATAVLEGVVGTTLGPVVVPPVGAVPSTAGGRRCATARLSALEGAVAQSGCFEIVHPDAPEVVARAAASGHRSSAKPPSDVALAEPGSRESEVGAGSTPAATEPVGIATTGEFDAKLVASIRGDTGEATQMRLAEGRAREERERQNRIAELKAHDEKEWERKIAEVRAWGRAARRPDPADRDDLARDGAREDRTDEDDEWNRRLAVARVETRREPSGRDDWDGSDDLDGSDGSDGSDEADGSDGASGRRSPQQIAAGLRIERTGSGAAVLVLPDGSRVEGLSMPDVLQLARQLESPRGS